MSERPPGYPFGEWDAMAWADEYIRIITENPDIDIDEGLMVGWFANALMTGHQRGYENGVRDSRSRFGERVEDGGVMGTIVRCEMCGGSGELHDPDELPPVSYPEGA